MNKTIIAIAIAAAAAAPMAANAAGTVYGQLQAEITQNDNGTDSDISVDDNARGRIGFKGSEEVGNGMTMIGKMEFKVDTADGDASKGSAKDASGDSIGVSLQKREMMVGLKQGWGTFSIGRLKSPYKYAGGVKYDPFVATALEARGVTMSGKVGTGKAMGHNGFQSDSVGVSLMGGKLNVTYGLDENGTVAADDGSNGDLAISYKHKMGKKNELVFALIQQGDSGDYSATKVGGKFGPVKFQVEIIDTGATVNEGVTNIFASYGMKMAGGKLIIQGGQSDADANADATTDVTVGYVKKFSKKARWFAGYRTTDSGATDSSALTYGMRFDY